MNPEAPSVEASRKQMPCSASLAERCYASTRVADDLFNAVNAALGCDTKECLNDGFVWGATDTWWDEYDHSIEVVRPEGVDWMSRTQADVILDLGFERIYESVGEAGRVWDHTSSGPCSPRKNSDSSEVRRLHTKVARLWETFQLIETYGGSVSSEGRSCDGSWCREQARAARAREDTQ